MKKCRHDNTIENKHKHKLFPRFIQNDKLLSFLGFENKNSKETMYMYVEAK